MKKKVAKVVIYVAGIMIFAAAAFMCSFDLSGLPQTPQPQTGRIYPLSGRGGFRGYITHREKVQRELSIGICALFIVVAAVTDYYADPFERRKRVKPLNTHWGP